MLDKLLIALCYVQAAALIASVIWAVWCFDKAIEEDKRHDEQRRLSNESL